MKVLTQLKNNFERVGVESFIVKHPGVTRIDIVIHLNIDFQTVDDILEELAAIGKIELRDFESYYPKVASWFMIIKY